MGLFMRNVAEKRFFCDISTGELFEESVDGRFALNQTTHGRTRVAVDSIPASAQPIFCGEEDAWRLGRPTERSSTACPSRGVD